MKPQGVGIDPILHKDFITEAKARRLQEFTPNGVLPDWAIRQFVTIEDFIDYGECPPGTISYGLTSAGYDIRVGGRFKVFTNANCETVNPKRLSQESYIDKDLTGHVWGEPKPDFGPEQSRQCIRCGAEWSDQKVARRFCREGLPGLKSQTVKIPPNCFALAETVEVLHIPRNVVCWCIGKSTYARCGINMNFTPFEPGWFGVVTVEIINATPLPVEIYPWEGIGQAEFFLMAAEPERAYGDKPNAKYQGQTGLTLPFVK